MMFVTGIAILVMSAFLQGTQYSMNVAITIVFSIMMAIAWYRFLTDAERGKERRNDKREITKISGD